MRDAEAITTGTLAVSIAVSSRASFCGSVAWSNNRSIPMTRGWADSIRATMSAKKPRSGGERYGKFARVCSVIETTTMLGGAWVKGEIETIITSRRIFSNGGDTRAVERPSRTR